MQHLVAISISAPTVQVAAADFPAALRVALSSAGSVVAQIDIPVVAVDPLPQSYDASLTVADGTYDGSVQAVRADGSLIGSPLAFGPVDCPAPPPATVSSPVPQAVSFTVTTVA